MNKKIGIFLEEKPRKFCPLKKKSRGKANAGREVEYCQRGLNQLLNSGDCREKVRPNHTGSSDKFEFIQVEGSSCKA